MTGERQHPAPQADKLSTGMALTMLFAGPLAWFLQLCASVVLLGWPCFPMMDRLGQPMLHYGWTRLAAAVLLLIALAVAVAAGLLSLRKLREVSDEKEGGHRDLIEIGHGRTRFTAMWGVILSFSFAVVIVLTAIPFLLVPRCVA